MALRIRNSISSWVCCSASTLAMLMGTREALAQSLPIPTDLEGYQQFWINQTPSQRIQLARGKDPLPTPPPRLAPPLLAPSIRVDSPTESTLPPDGMLADPASGTTANLLNLSDQPQQPWVQSDEPLEVLAPQFLAQQTPDNQVDVNQASQPPEGVMPVAVPRLPSASPLSSAPSSSAVFTPVPFTQASASLDPDLLSRFPLLAETQSSTGLPALSGGATSSAGFSNSTSELTSETTFPTTPDTPAGLDPDLLNRFPLLTPNFAESPDLAGQGTPDFDYDARVLALFPVFPWPEGVAFGGQSSTLDSQGSRIRQELSTGVQAQLPLDPNQVNLTADNLTFLADQQVGVAQGNAVARFSDGTILTGDKLLYYRRDQRIRSEGPFVMKQPPGNGRSGLREVYGQNLDFDIPSRSAQFESSLVIVPGEAAGTKVFIRSEETTALIQNQMFFENATVTTSPELPITHYVKGDRVEVYPNDQLIIHTARVFAGGDQNANGDVSGGTQIAFFPLFIYSLRDHQWILPGYNSAEGVYVKSSWAYRFDPYNFGGLRIDAIQKKGVGLGFVHDYILPIPDSSNYGRAQAYLVTEADQNRVSGRFRVDHFYDFYASRILGTDGDLQGQLIINYDTVYRTTGGRNDNADFQLNSTFQADLSTTTLNISRNASAMLGTYRIPITLNHAQRYGGAAWVRSNLRLDYINQLSVVGGPDSSNARLEFNTQATPPGWGGNYSLTYRTFSSSSGDTDGSRRNLEMTFNPDVWRISPQMTFTNNLAFSQNQQRDFLTGIQRFFNQYNLRSSLRYNDIQLADWATFAPGSLDYQQTLYSTGDQESQVSLNPRLSLKPNNASSLEFRFSRTFNGNNTRPFQTFSSVTQDTHRINANLSLFTPQGNLATAPPGYLVFEDDLPGEAPIALTFEDDSPEDRQELASKQETEAKATIRNLFRFDSSTGFDYINKKWDTITANFTWNTAPSLFNVSLTTSYDANLGQLNPVNLRYSGRTSTTFQRDLRSGLDKYEPGFSYGLQAVYDPKQNTFSSYSIDLDTTLGTEWQNHWRVRLGLDQNGIDLIEVRRDLRDFEVRFSYDPQAALLRLEGILVAFPSQPVGLTQQQGQFLLNTPVGTLGSDSLP